MPDKPAIFYKYRTLNNHTETLLSKRELYFPTLKEINDPFDCRIILNRDAPVEVLWERVKAHYRKKYGTVDEVELVRLMISEYAPPGVEVTAERAAAIVERKEWTTLSKHIEAGNARILVERMEKVRLCCFSERNDSILMWSHYSGSHRGICLGFAADAVIGRAEAVEYVEEYPDVSAYDIDDDSYYRYTLLTKAADWTYEKEWRLVLTAADRVLTPVYHFPQETLKEVIFGCRCTSDDKLKVQRWVSAGGLQPTYFEAVPSRNAFKLEIRKLS